MGLCLHTVLSTLLSQRKRYALSFRTMEENPLCQMPLSFIHLLTILWLATTHPSKTHASSRVPSTHHAVLLLRHRCARLRDKELGLPLG